MLKKARKTLLFLLGLVLALLLAGLSAPGALGSGNTDSFSQKESGPRVINGTTANPADWPFFVSLSSMPLYPYQANNHPYCGGSLVGDRWVLTAAHCFLFYQGEEFWATIGRSDLLINTGSEIRGSEVFLHPRFAGKQNNYAPPYDAALLRLRAPLGDTFAELIKEGPGAGKSSRLAGFGIRNAKTGALTTSLLEGENETITNDKCRKQSPRGAFFFFRSQLCTETSNGQGACYGDSGGPLVYSGKLIGLVSTGDAACRKGTRADIYSKASALRPWVLNTISRGTSRGNVNFIKGDSYGKRRFRIIAQVNSRAKKARLQFNRRVCDSQRCYKRMRSFSLPRIPVMENPGRYTFFHWSHKVFRSAKTRCLGARVSVRFQNNDFSKKTIKICPRG